MSAWAALLACGYPVIEVLYSMWRRWRGKLSAGAPDNRHLHSLVKTQLILPRFQRWNPRLRNAAASPVMWLYAALPASLVVLLEEASQLMLVSAFCGCVLVYHLFYRRLAARANSAAVAHRSAKNLSIPAASLTPPVEQPVRKRRQA